MPDTQHPHALLSQDNPAAGIADGNDDHRVSRLRHSIAEIAGAVSSLEAAVGDLMLRLAPLTQPVAVEAGEVESKDENPSEDSPTVTALHTQMGRLVRSTDAIRYLMDRLDV